MGIARPLALALVATGLAGLLLAQPGRRGGPQPPEEKHFDIRGRIHSFDAKVINVLTEENKPWRIKVPQGSNVRVNGTASVDALLSKLAVRFEATINDRGVATEPLKKITVFSVRKFFKPRIEEVSEEETDDEPREEEPVTEEKSAEPVEDGTVEQTEAEEKDNSPAARRRRRRERARERAEQPPRLLHVTGILKSFNRRKGQIVVDVGEAGTVRSMLAPEIVVDVDFTSHAFARPGDTIHVSGKYTPWEDVMELPEDTIREGTASKTVITLAVPEIEQPERGEAKRSTTP